MRLGSPAVSQLSQEAYDWLLELLSALEARDPYALGVRLAEDCTLQINSDPPIEGRAAVLNRLACFRSSFSILEHEPLSIHGTDKALALETLNHYTRDDGTPVALRAVTLTDRDEGGLVTSIRQYADTTALYVRPSH